MFERINATVSRYSDLVLAGCVIAVIATMIVGLPPTAVDFLIATNISIAVLILLVSLYIRDAARLPSFPTILLLTTLFRLALNVTTTRLILLDADAGDIIDAFGEFVVRGNYVVGGIIFLILVLIQFIVIAKGSERVAEVSARFTLDAMQGKQMSIDADLRNQLIDPEEARRRRRSLDRESKLYGAMDGAMKFVKGDAIAGIIISAINIIGGLIVGIAQQKMAAAEAAETYSLLTIGDGLVSQIPALLISVSAGIVVTRVAMSDDDRSHLASELIGQFLEHRRAFGIASVLLFAFGASMPVTGFPAIPFVVLGSICAILALGGRTMSRRLEESTPITADAPITEEASDDARARRPIYPLCIDIDPGLEAACLPADDARLRQIRTEMRIFSERASDQFGIDIPIPRFRKGNRRLPANGYAISINDVPVASDIIAPDAIVAFCTPQMAQEIGLPGQTFKLPWDPMTVAWVTIADRRDVLREQRIPFMAADAVILEHVRHVIRRHAHEFLGLQETGNLLEQLRQRGWRELVQTVMTEPQALQRVTEGLRLLLRERIPIRNLPQILESMLTWMPKEDSMADVMEHVRRDIRRVVSNANASSLRRLTFIEVSNEIEQRVTESVHFDARGPRLAMIQEDADEIGQALVNAHNAARPHTPLPVIMTQSHARLPMLALLDRVNLRLPVMSYAEVAEEFQQDRVADAQLTARRED